MKLTDRTIAAFERAESLIEPKNFSPYLDMKDLLNERGLVARRQFRETFTKYYGLNVGGLTDEFKERYFAILFSQSVMLDGEPDFEGILTELSSFERRSGSKGMPFSFVSKLVNMHDESSAIYDRHVANLFSLRPPAAKVAGKVRIQEFIAILDEIERSYITWSRNKRVAEVLTRFRRRDPRLKKCHVVRRLDFLVWKIGSEELLKKREGQ